MNEESEAMRNFRPQICTALSLAATSSVALAQAPSSPAVPVTVDSYIRAQSDIYFGQTVKAGAFGKFRHGRELAPIDRRLIIRPNRDTLYSLAVFDFDAGPVTVTLPDAGKRFMVMQVVNEDQYTPAVFYGAGRHTLTKEGIGTRYGIVVVRMLVDPANPQDVQQVHALQDALTVSQQSPGTFEIPDWDEASLRKVHTALLQLGETISDTRRMFGAKEDQVDPVRHLIGTALVWGGLPEKDALYLNITPDNTEGGAVYKLNIQDVGDGPEAVDGYRLVPQVENTPHTQIIPALRGVAALRIAGLAAAAVCCRVQDHFHEVSLGWQTARVPFPVWDLRLFSRLPRWVMARLR
jgi:hypothetical protein